MTGPQDKHSIKSLTADLSKYPYWKVPFGKHMAQSSVAIPVKETPSGLSFLMLKRAKRKGDPWSGDMSFPGGKQSSSDKSLVETALRETAEETGVCVPDDHYLGQLSDVFTRTHRNNAMMRVSVHVVKWPDQAEISHSHESVDEHWFPLSHFGREARQSMVWDLGRYTPLPFKFDVPVYYHKGYRVWGLSLMMIDELYRIVELNKKKPPTIIQRIRS